MIKKLLSYKGFTALVAGLTIVILVTLAQANMADARLKLGGLLELNDDDVKVGGLYEIGKNGYIRPTPACKPPSPELLARYFAKEQSGNYVLRNSFGDFLPQLLPQLVAEMAEGIQTLTLKSVSDTEIAGKAQINVALNDLIEETGAQCEEHIRKVWFEQTCVSLVYRVIKSGGTVLGYRYSENCVVPNMPDEEDYDKGLMKAPLPATKFSGYVSRFKNSMEWLSVSKEEIVETASAE